jgi:hypothetical protein
METLEQLGNAIKVMVTKSDNYLVSAGKKLIDAQAHRGRGHHVGRFLAWRRGDCWRSIPRWSSTTLSSTSSCPEFKCNRARLATAPDSKELSTCLKKIGMNSRKFCVRC